ncbi:protein LURP-one-related 8-like [Canna indica]|uniref:Protein LURP-one-related 8-like n=1 Tax=Canna indica TaxID=4628 RepID=A0AAQ3L0J7_9LILI|nr:protein LURP-one-related 8-like [Canna indica]
MTKVHPNALSAKLPRAVAPTASGEAAALTVWRKSLLFHGEGFTVFDAKGNLVFRVDNYGSASRGEIVLMDAAGKPLLTIRRKKLSLGDHWLIYEGEEAANPRFAVKKHVNFISSRSLAHVTPRSSAAKSCLAYEVEGSYSRRCCAVYDERRRQLAQVKRKQTAAGVAFGNDVFHLIVEPGFDSAFAMGIVILLEQMFGPRGSLLKV